MSEPVRPPTSEDEPPPFLSTWRNVYVLVVTELVVSVIVFYLLARWAS